MNREELIKALKDWKPELELLAKYNDNSIDYQRYRALDETIKTLEQIPNLKEAYNKGYKDGQEALAFHLELCEEEAEPCISREEVCDYIAEFVNHEYATDREHEMVEHIIGGIQHLPSIQPKTKTGHWIEDDMTYCGVELVNYKCDKCGEMGGAWRKGLKPDKLPKYCMNCGAKMLPTDSEKE